MSTLQDILNKLPKLTRDKFIVRAKNAFDLGWTEHSNKLIAAQIVSYAKTLPASRVKTRMNTLAAFVILHPEMCYEDFSDYFINNQGWLDSALRDEMIKAFADYPMVRKYLRQHWEPYFPNLGGGAW